MDYAYVYSFAVSMSRQIPGYPMAERAINETVEAINASAEMTSSLPKIIVAFKFPDRLTQKEENNLLDGIYNAFRKAHLNVDGVECLNVERVTVP